MYISEEELLSRTLIMLVLAIDTMATITITSVFLDVLNALNAEAILSFQFDLDSCELFHVAPWYPWLLFIIIAYVLGDEIL